MSAHTAQTELKLVGKLILEGEMHCETGLHIGAGKGSLEIGGADNPVVKDSHGRPYVPGSTLRGRIRALLEQATGAAVPSELVYISKRKGQEVRIHQSDRPDDEICILFGRSPGRMEKVGGGDLESNHATPARLSVFDAPLVADSITPQMRETLDDELTEVKSENAIDRITSQANPRTCSFQGPHGAGYSLPGRCCAARLAGAGSALARRRYARRRWFARQWSREFRRLEAGLARQGFLCRRRGRTRNRLRGRSCGSWS
jgi:CRISPR-associated protein Csm3